MQTAYVGGGQKCREFAQRNHQVVENITHAIMSWDHGAFPVLYNNNNLCF